MAFIRIADNEFKIGRIGILVCREITKWSQCGLVIYIFIMYLISKEKKLIRGISEIKMLSCISYKGP